jgi:hypothetical protein
MYGPKGYSVVEEDEVFRLLCAHRFRRVEN